MFEKFTEKAKRILFLARYEASQQGSKQINGEHILLAADRLDVLPQEFAGAVYRALRALVWVILLIHHQAVYGSRVPEHVVSRCHHNICVHVDPIYEPSVHAT